MLTALRQLATARAEAEKCLGTRVAPNFRSQMSMVSSDWLIRAATAADVCRMHAIARAAYAKYVPRIGREPAPMVADYAAAIVEHDAVVIESAESVCGYMIAWPEGDAYFIENIGVDPARQREGLARIMHQT